MKSRRTIWHIIELIRKTKQIHSNHIFLLWKSLYYFDLQIEQVVAWLKQRKRWNRLLLIMLELLEQLLLWEILSRYYFWILHENIHFLFGTANYRSDLGSSKTHNSPSVFECAALLLGIYLKVMPFQQSKKKSVNCNCSLKTCFIISAISQESCKE